MRVRGPYEQCSWIVDDAAEFLIVHSSRRHRVSFLMKRGLLILFAGVSFLTAAFAAQSPPGFEFSGVLGGGKDLRVALTNKTNGTTQWVAVGSSHAGYLITSYDSNVDVGVVTKGGESFRLALKQGKTTKAAAKPPPEVERAILNNLRQLAAAADQYYLENGKNTTNYDELVGETKYVKSLTPLNGESYRAIQFVQGRKMTVTTAGGYSVSYDP